MKKDKIQSMYKACSAELTSRSNEIFHFLLGEGNYDAKVMIIGFMPSSKEEEYSQNILEHEREKLMEILDPLGLTIEDVYITHLMKYRPYRINEKGRIVSRTPSDEELDFFVPYLEKEISLISPQIIITINDEPLRWITGNKDIKVNIKEDQLLVTGIMGKSYKLYPIISPSSNKYHRLIEKFNKDDKTRLRTILYGEGLDEVVTIKAIDNIINKEQSKITKPKKRMFTKVKVAKLKDSNKDYITIVYGGEGFVDDPVLVALERISSILTELGLGIHRIDLYKENIPMEKSLSYINSSSGAILGVNVEWYGIGHRMQKFLDQCFFNGDTKYFENKPLMGVAFTRHSFERDAYEHLRKSWEVLGGREGVSLCASIETAAKLETNFDWLYGIDKKSESYFRILKQDKGILPVSRKTEKVSIEMPMTEIDAHVDKKLATYNKTTEEVKGPLNTGMIEDYDTFVERQQEDIKQLSSLFKRKLANKNNKDNSIPGILKEAYINKKAIKSTIQLLFDDQLKENTVIELNDQHIRAYYGQVADVDVSISGKQEIFMKIFQGKVTMQRAFMTGEIKAKGDFTIIYKFEEYFKL